jgi:hypothetical protein
MRRMLTPLLALSLLLVALAAPMAATAAPTGAGAGAGVAADAGAPGSCPKPLPYPPAPHATVLVNTTNPFVGEKIEVSGINYCPDEDVDIRIENTHVATAHTDGKGRFDPQVVVPAPAGAKQVCGIGASGLATDSDCMTIVARAGSGASTPPTNPNSGTATTGVKIALLGLLALVLVVSGVVLATLGRHRRAARL